MEYTITDKSSGKTHTANRYDVGTWLRSQFTGMSEETSGFLEEAIDVIENHDKVPTQGTQGYLNLAIEKGEPQ